MKRLIGLLIAASLCLPVAASAYWKSIQQVGVTSGASLACSYTPVTTGTQGTAYTGATPSASGGTPAYTFSETGTLPGGLSISSSTGIISGTPSANGSFPSIQVIVTDSLSNTANCGSAFTLVISPSVTPMVTAILNNQGQSIPSASLAQFTGLTGGIYGGTITTRDTPDSINGTISNLTVQFWTTIASGNYFITLYQNGVATGLQCEVGVATGLQTCSSATNVTVAPGDTLAWQSCPGTHSGVAGSCTTSAATAQSLVPSISATLTSTATGEGVIIATAGAVSAVSTTAANYTNFSDGQSVNSTEANISTVIPTAGTLDHLYLVVGTAPGTAPKQYVYSIFQNGVNTGISCTLTGTGSGAGITTCNDTTHSISVLENDLISIETCPGSVSLGTCTPANTPTSPGSVRASLRWLPTIPGEAILMNAIATSIGTSPFFSISASPNAGAEGNNLNIAPGSFTVKKMHIAVSPAPGAGTPSRTMTLRSGTGSGQSNSTVTCQVTTTTSCNDNSHTLSASLGTLLDLGTVGASSPAATTYFKHSWVVTQP